MAKEEHPAILVVEDDESIANLLRINLNLAGFQPILARDGEEAIRKFDQDNVRLVLLDLMIPGKDGWEVLAYIQEKRRGEVPVIITSAKTQRADLEKGFSMGIVDYVTKPFDPLDLAEKIRHILSRINHAEKK